MLFTETSPVDIQVWRHYPRAVNLNPYCFVTHKRWFMQSSHNILALPVLKHVKHNLTKMLKAYNKYWIHRPTPFNTCKDNELMFQTQAIPLVGAQALLCCNSLYHLKDSHLQIAQCWLKLQSPTMGWILLTRVYSAYDHVAYTDTALALYYVCNTHLPSNESNFVTIFLLA